MDATIVDGEGRSRHENEQRGYLICEGDMSIGRSSAGVKDIGSTQKPPVVELYYSASAECLTVSLFALLDILRLEIL